MSFFRTCYQCGKGTMVRYATDEAICSECIDNPVSTDELSVEKLQERCDRYEKKLATAVEALKEVERSKYGMQFRYDRNPAIAKQALAEIGGEDES